MDTKRKIGIVYNGNSNWIAGLYYLNSIISVLKKNKHLFEVYFIFFNKKKPADNLPFVVIKYRFIDRVINYLGRKYPKVAEIYINTVGIWNIKRLETFDLIFPVVSGNMYFDKLPDEKKIFWIPDFQENYFPLFFQKKEIIDRIISQIGAAYSKGKLVLSSKGAYNDFIRLYPNKYCNIKLVPFISSLCFEENCILSHDEITSKYNITNDYFICSNQFWIHKNHIVIINAVSLLMKEKINIKVYFTGKEYDYRTPYYTKNLKAKVQELSLEENVQFLGFIPRKEQITLMKYAMAIIQPSFFEGWNTTIEDAKYLEKVIVASNIDVHREQLGNKGYYFDPANAEDLASRMKEIYYKKLDAVNYSYKEQYLEYDDNIVDLFS